MSCITCNSWGFFWCVSTYLLRFWAPWFFEGTNKTSRSSDRVDHWSQVVGAQRWDCLWDPFVSVSWPTIYPPWKPNSSPLKNDGWKMNFLLKWFLLGGYVNFWEGTVLFFFGGCEGWLKDENITASTGWHVNVSISRSLGFHNLSNKNLDQKCLENFLKLWSVANYHSIQDVETSKKKGYTGILKTWRESVGFVGILHTFLPLLGLAPLWRWRFFRSAMTWCNPEGWWGEWFRLVLVR